MPQPHQLSLQACPSIEVKVMLRLLMTVPFDLLEMTQLRHLYSGLNLLTVDLVTAGSRGAWFSPMVQETSWICICAHRPGNSEQMPGRSEGLLHPIRAKGPQKNQLVS
jgi:hypothetical protein